MMEKYSPTIENYLGLLYVLERDKEPAVGSRLAELLGVSHPTITNTLKRMSRDGLVKIDSSHIPHLTPQGCEAARSLMRRHMLAEWMLSNLLTWSRVHEEAHAFEHAISPDVEAALIRELNSPALCPHGNPLPGYEGVVAGWIPLNSFQAGQDGIIRRIHELAEDTPQVLEFLEGKNLKPGTHVRVLENLPFNQTVSIEVNSDENVSKTIAIGYSMARYLFLEPE
jgi:DtxR family Mn-dependent transcriptional regulator